MPKKQRPSEGDSTFLAPESLPPPVAIGRERQTFGRLGEVPVIPDREPQEEPPLPTVSGHGIAQSLTKKGWVAYRCATDGEVSVLTPRRADGSLEGESKQSAVGRMMAAIVKEYAR